jgi:hypothetical protein
MLRSILAIAGICSVFTLWAIAVSADDARQGKLGLDRSVAAAQAGY